MSLEMKTDDYDDDDDDDDDDDEFTFNLSVLSYKALEEYLCHIVFGLEHQKDDMIKSYDLNMYLQLIHLAHRFGSEHLVREYFSACHEVMENSSSLVPNYIDVLEAAIEVSSNPNILRTLQLLLKRQDIFVESLHYISKQKIIEGCINRLIESLKAQDYELTFQEEETEVAVLEL